MPINGYFDTVFASSGDVTSVPDATQPDGSVSYTQGFPILYSTPVSSGGYNVPRGATNQLYKDITTAVQKLQQGNAPAFITSVMNNGSPYSYDQYATAYASGASYVSVQNSNTDSPGSSTKWVRGSAGISGGGSVTTGHVAVFVNTLGTLGDGGPARMILTVDTTYYVSTTGNDSNNGTVGAPWRTIQHALDYIQSYIDINGHTVTVSVADGTYAGANVSGPFIGGSGVYVTGNVSTPANCIASSSSTNAFTAQNGAFYNVGGFRVTTTNGSGLVANRGATINIFGNMNFGACSESHIVAQQSGQVIIGSGYTISGGATNHWYGNQCGIIATSTAPLTFTLSGTPAFSGGAFANAYQCGIVNVPGLIFSGSGTGPRYLAALNGVINTSGAGTSYLPGNAAGSAVTGGQYA